MRSGRKKVLFSEPYFDAYQCLVVREDEDRDITVDNIAEQGLIIAVQMGTTALLLLKISTAMPIIPISSTQSGPMRPSWN